MADCSWGGCEVYSVALERIWEVLMRRVSLFGALLPLLLPHWRDLQKPHTEASSGNSEKTTGSRSIQPWMFPDDSKCADLMKGFYQFLLWSVELVAVFKFEFYYPSPSAALILRPLWFSTLPRSMNKPQNNLKHDTNGITSKEWSTD